VFFTAPAPTEIYALSLHDALPIFKGLDTQIIPVHLLRDGGEQKKPDYLRVNPTGLVPTLVDGDITIAQSMAILEYLEETHPEPRSEEHTSELQSRENLVCRLLLET